MKPNLRAAGALTLIATTDASLASSGLCVARAPEVLSAYAVATGEPSGRLAGMQLLIDSAGWIRERWNDGVQVNTASLMERIRAVRAKPLKMPAMAAHAGH
jgi:hypothetical protein